MIINLETILMQLNKWQRGEKKVKEKIILAEIQ